MYWYLIVFVQIVAETLPVSSSGYLSFARAVSPLFLYRFGFGKNAEYYGVARAFTHYAFA